MVFGVRGPKAILASKIASALAEYFVVDTKSIESNLLKDTKIVLYNVLLRQQRSRLHEPDSNGRTAVVNITGVVEEVVFTWTWSKNKADNITAPPIPDSSSKEGWVKNAALAIRGLKFEAEFMYCESESDEVANIPLSTDDQAKPDADGGSEVSTKTKFGIQGFIQEQVKLIIDSLNLNVTDFQFTMKLPPTEKGSENFDPLAIVVGAKALQLQSFGRQKAETTTVIDEGDSYVNQQPDGQDDTVLEQRLTISSFYSSVTAQTGTDEEAVHPLLDPFSYSAAVTRLAGDRFSSGFGYGLEVVGQPIATAVEAKLSGLDNGLVFHAGTVQLLALTQLGKMVLSPSKDKKASSVLPTATPPPSELTLPLKSNPLLLKTIKEVSGSDTASDEDDSDPSASSTDGREAENETSAPIPASQDIVKVEDGGPTTTGGSTVTASVASNTDIELEKNKSSIFKFAIMSLSLVVSDTTKITVEGATMTYRADGTVCRLDGQSFKVEDSSSDTDDVSILVVGLRASLEPTLVMEFDVVETARVADVFELAKPMYDTTIKFEGETFCIQMASVETMLIRGKAAENSTATEAVEKSKPAPASETEAPRSTGSFSILRGKHSIQKDSPPNESQDERSDVLLSGKQFDGNEFLQAGGENAAAEDASSGAVEGMATSFSSSATDADSQSHEEVGSKNLLIDETMTETAAPLVGTASELDTVEPTPDQEHVPETEKVVALKPSFSAPFPISISLKELVLAKSSDRGQPSVFTDLNIDVIPGSEGTFVAFCLGEFENELLGLRNVASSAVLDLEHRDVVRNFKFAAESGRVTAGYSTGDWSMKFDAKDANHAKDTKDTKRKSTVTKLPFAEVAALRLRITLKGGVVEANDTALNIKPYVGGSNTTKEDLVNHYARAILSRAPHFVTNAEVLGVNVIDSAAVSYGTWLAAATPMGAAGGLAGIAAVDAIKGTIAVGKSRRNASADDQWEFGDFSRGMIHLMDAISSSGATTRGKDEDDSQDIADFAVGVVAGTGEYVGENKARLGAAGAGGAGFLVGTMLGGPLGGIAGALLASALTGKTIEGVEEHLSKQPKPIEKEPTLTIQDAEFGDVSNRMQTLTPSSEDVESSGGGAPPHTTTNESASQLD